MSITMRARFSSDSQGVIAVDQYYQDLDILDRTRLRWRHCEPELELHAERAEQV